MLSEMAIRNAKPGDKAKKLSDGGGLFLMVTPAGGRWWRLNYRFNGRQKTLSLGVYPHVSLREAREKREAAKKLLSQGTDPGAARKEAKAAAVASAAAEQLERENTFELAAERWYAHHGKKVVPATLQKSRMYLDVLKRKLAGIPISQLDRKILVDAVQVIQGQLSPHFARRAAGILKNVLDLALNEGRIAEHRAYELAKVLQPVKTTHRAALINPAELGALLRKIWGYQGEAYSVSYCLKILPYLALRSVEIRGARWSELDLDAGLWTIPATRHEHGGGMKMRVEHLVTLPGQVVGLFREMKQKQALLYGDCELCFPSPRSPLRPITGESLIVALKVIHGSKNISVHGFRASFSTLAREQGFNAEHIEKQLAHQLKDAVEAAYNRATYAEPRRRMMQAWADYLDELRTANAGS